MMNPDNKTRPSQLPQIVPLIATLVFTAVVGLYTAFTLCITYAHLNTQKGWLVCGITVLPVWALVGYCWHRVATEKPVARPEVCQEQPEGVWPPAPLVSARGDNKD